MLTGFGLLIQTSNQLGSITLSWESYWDNKPKGKIPDLNEIYSLLVIVQTVFPNLFISSNRAEQFNSVHDREIRYSGNRSLGQANNHLKAWILFKYHDKGIQYFLMRQKIVLPMSFIDKTAHLTIDGVKFLC